MNSTTQNRDLQGFVERINKILQDGEPTNITKDPFADYTGYKPQTVIDATNDVLGLQGWGFVETESTVDNSEKPLLQISRVSVWIMDRNNPRTACGQSRITRGDVGDAMKGAQTDALKKALSYFSIGNRAYLGLLDPNKNAILKQGRAGRGTQTSDKPMSASTTTSPIPTEVKCSVPDCNYKCTAAVIDYCAKQLDCDPLCLHHQRDPKALRDFKRPGISSLDQGNEPSDEVHGMEDFENLLN